MRIPAQTLKLLQRKAGVRLDLGCGHGKHPGFVGMDRRPDSDADIVHDLEVTPWPLPSDCATTAILSHVWEHISPKVTLAVMDELWRVLRHEASVLIAAPYGMGYRYMQDPTHCNPSVEATWLYWEPAHLLYQVYRPTARFHLVSYEIVPVGGDRDFNAVLQVCKPRGKGTCAACAKWGVK